MPDTQLLPGYLIVGADEFKRSTAVARMRSRLEKTGLADFNLDEREMDRDPQIDDIISSLNTLPMMTDFRLVILKNCENLPKSVSEPLVEYFANPSPTTVCLVVAEKLLKTSRLYKAMAKIGPKAIIDCTPKKGRDLFPQVIAMARAHGKAMSMPAAQELVSRAGESTRLLDNELKRLAQQVPGPSIEVADIERLVMRTAEAKPWELLDAVSSRDMGKSLELLELQPANTEVLILSLLTARIRELIVAKALEARGEGRELAARLGKQQWQVRNHVAWARRFSMDELLNALAGAADVELALKGSRDSELALRTWIIGLISK